MFEAQHGRSRFSYISSLSSPHESIVDSIDPMNFRRFASYKLIDIYILQINLIYHFLLTNIYILYMTKISYSRL